MRHATIGLLLFVSVAAHAATIAGRTSDSTGALLPGVTIEAGGVVEVSGRDGTYSLHVEPGTYDVAFRLINFATILKRAIAVSAKEPAHIDVTLYLSSSADVVVTARQTFRNLADLSEPVNDLLGIADAASVGVVTSKQIEERPFARPGEILETVPGVVISQHSGEGKANQYYLRGFNLDHGTDIAFTVAGVPVNMPTHAHGQGYADMNFLIPELISGVQYKKGPYSADEGDFASAGAINVNYLNILDRPIALAQGGTFGDGRALFAQSAPAGPGFLLYAVEAARNNGPWRHPDDFRKWNAILRYSGGDQRGGWSLTGTAYDAKWNSTDQIPGRAVADGLISRFGAIDPTDGGNTHRYSLSGEWQRNSSTALTEFSAYAVKYGLDLFSNFTYFLDDPVNGDQFEQADDRFVTGLRGSRRWLSTIGGVAAESVIGFQARNDDITNVALYHTRDRQRLSTTRSDSVTETSEALYGQTTLQWTSTLRSVAGLRADRYDFHVQSTQSSSLVSPKFSLIAGPWRNTEVYANAGYGFHSNDARSGADPLVRTRGAELGIRTTPIPRIHLTAAFWGLDIASELLFAGDAGTTEPSRPSRRSGVELMTFFNVTPSLAIDADYAYSRARFRDYDPAGNRIPGAIEGVASTGLSLNLHRFSGELRYRYFGPRPLIDDNSVRSAASSLVNARLSYAVMPRVRLGIDVFNFLNARVSDVDYFYTSRLRGEPASGVDDIHFHPVETRSLRFSISTGF